MNEALLLQWKQFCGIFTFLHKEALAILDHKSRTSTKANKENWPSLASTLVEIVFLKFDILEASTLDCNLAILIISLYCMSLSESTLRGMLIIVVHVLN